jgi:hypothetical protein
MTDRTANAVVVNATGGDIAGISLIHKYSDVYVDSKDWNGLVANGQTASPALQVRYHTGFLTTGTDWWRVAWVDGSTKAVCMTNPNNFQGIFNMIEGLLKDNASWAELKLLEEAPESGEGAPFLVAAAAVVKALDANVLNNASTVGFKENMLRDDDSGQTVTITLNADKTATISSPSGESETVWTAVSPS